MQDDICIVCAEPLLWTAYGPCGHKDTCSQCVTRLRSVLKDERCVYCQQPLACVFVTRFMGDYTQVIPAGDFDKLQGRAKSRELHYLDAAQAYFDDAGHFQEIAHLCSYTHPKVWEGDPSGRHKSFKTLQQLKQQLQQLHGLQFCNVCLEGRKVFPAEQCVYTKAELDRHMKTGDVEGPMAESGFKGHPECRFCRKRYYGENELYQHMHTGHEQCFLCKRANPNRFVYYRDYPDLENHFRHDHHLCQHPSCLEKKFVVFASEQEFKQHCAREHGGEMTKAEKRQALTIPVNFSYRRGGAEEPAGAGGSSSSSHLAAAAAAVGRAVVIGGGASMAAPSRFARRGGGRAEQQQTAQALQASLDTAAAERAAERALRHSASQPNLQSPAPSRPGSAQGAAAEAGEGGSRAGGLSLTEADFPLPEGVSGPGGGAAVGGRWVGGASSSVGAGGALRPEDFPALPGMSKNAKKKAKAQKSLAQMLAGPKGGVRVINAGASGSGGRGAPSLRDDSSFPTLRHSTSAPSLAQNGGGLSRPPLPSEPAPEPEPEWQEVSAPRLSQRQLAAQQKLAAKQAKDKQSKERQQAAQQQQQQAQQAAEEAVAPAAAAAAAAAAGGRGGAAGVSEALKAANKALVERIKKQLNAQQFGTFRQLSMDWVKGAIDSQHYHRQVTELGLAGLVPDLAATCPDATKRAELLAVHKEAFQDGSAPQGAGGWVPPEAAAAAAAHAERFSSWQCGVCTLLNAPSAPTCEACGHPKPRPGEDAANQWKKETRAAAFSGGGLSALAPHSWDEDPTLPTLQQASGAAGGKGKKGSKGGSGSSSSAAGAAAALAAQAAPVSFSAAAARAAAAGPSSSGFGGAGSSSAGVSRPPSSASADFPSLGDTFPALGGGSSSSSSSSAAVAAAQMQQQQEEEAGDEGGSGAAGGGKGGKGKGKQKKQGKFERLRLTGGDPATKQWLEAESRWAVLGYAAHLLL